ncbi:hypothetical protein RvY_03232 [Ramazzottius varieornatus]|uniref:Uncharacterized protein n=1 Tax=Ramazzottius varieornatus TaxID=947166 RepID=A0A1D1UWR6_RAMVA|nr:hypothetical protein RvY_03232 [Ramazzottius varieornatus]
MEVSASPTKHQSDELMQWKELIMDMDYHCGGAFYSKPLKSETKELRHTPTVTTLPTDFLHSSAEPEPAFVPMKDVSTTDSLFSHLNSQNMERLGQLLKEKSKKTEVAASSTGRGVKRRSDMLDLSDDARSY